MNAQKSILTTLAKSGRSIDELVQDTGFSRATVEELCRQMRAAGTIHIGDWQSSTSKPRMVYAFGPGIDAPRPKYSKPPYLQPKRNKPARQPVAASVFHQGYILNGDRAGWMAVNESFYKRKA